MRPIFQKELRHVLQYNEIDGIFTWIDSRGGAVKTGDRAGRKRKDGYVDFRIFGKRILAHRAAWVYVHGEIPAKLFIDHINGVRDDNRICNLRLVSRAQNNQNRRKANCNSQTKLLGVTPLRGKFQATICYAGLQHYLGLFFTEKEAHCAYLNAKRKYHKGCLI